MSCCSSNGTNKFFTKHAKRYAKTFRRKGLDKPSKCIFDALCRIGIQSKSLLEIGSGVGGLYLMLLKRGAANAQGVEISEGMILAAKNLAEEMGLDARVRHHQGDFVSLNGEITATDIVILDKVLCCYPNHNELISKAAEKTTDIYAVSYPRNSLLNKLVFRSAAWLGELLHWSFHPYYHDTVDLDRAITKCGLSEAFADTTFTWQIKIFRRQRQ